MEPHRCLTSRSTFFTRQRTHRLVFPPVAHQIAPKEREANKKVKKNKRERLGSQFTEALTVLEQAGKRKGKKRRGKRNTKEIQNVEAREIEERKKMKDKGKRSVDERYAQWKSLVPVLYDWLANHNLVWPSLSCRYLLLALVPRVSVFISLSGAFPHCCVNLLF